MHGNTVPTIITAVPCIACSLIGNITTKNYGLFGSRIILGLYCYLAAHVVGYFLF